MNDNPIISLGSTLAGSFLKPDIEIEIPEHVSIEQNPLDSYGFFMSYAGWGDRIVGDGI